MKNFLKVTSKVSGQTVSTRCVWAKDAWSRLVGLLGHDALEENESILIEPCKQVHTLFMKFPIDVVFLDNNNTILDFRSMTPWKFSPLKWKAAKILELPLGTCQRVGLEVGHSLAFESEDFNASA